MDVIRIGNTNEIIVGEDKVREFLNQYEVIYEHWDTDKLPPELPDNFSNTDGQKSAILNFFQSEIQKLASRRGYRTWDVNTLSESTPNIEELLENGWIAHPYKNQSFQKA